MSDKHSIDDKEWGVSKLIAFRFAFVYVLLFCFTPFGAASTFVPWPEFFFATWAGIVKWFGKTLFGIPISILPGGSGDTTFNFVEVTVWLLLAFVVTTIWSLLETKRNFPTRRYQLFRMLMRLTLALQLVTYAANKVIPIQFPRPMQFRLVQPLGDVPPMAFFWTFMGASPGYIVFTGCLELVCALLLAFQRTTLAGSLLGIGIMGHVFVLNLCYDIPVKLFSMHLLAIAILLFAPDCKRFLTSLFACDTENPKRDRQWTPQAVMSAVIPILIIGSAIYFLNRSNIIQEKLKSKPLLYGVWTTTYFELDGEERPPLLTDDDRWHRLVFDQYNIAARQRMDGDVERFSAEVRIEEHTLTFRSRPQDGPEKSEVYTFTQPDENALVIEGSWNDLPFQVRLQRDADRQFALTSRGFHWISEYPFNR